jgi:hypothetical protein
MAASPNRRTEARHPRFTHLRTEEEMIMYSTQVIDALALLRSLAVGQGGALENAVNTLDNAGVFADVDEDTDYDVSPKGYARQGEGVPAQCLPYHRGEYVNLNRDGRTEQVMVEKNHGAGMIEVRFLNSEGRTTVQSGQLDRN